MVPGPQFGNSASGNISHDRDNEVREAGLADANFSTEVLFGGERMAGWGAYESPHLVD